MHKIARRVALVAAMAAMLGGAGQAGERIPGRWAKQGQFVQLNIGCSQAWVCVPRQDVMYSSDLRLSGPERQTTLGACSAGGGPIDGCNYCLAREPEEACELTLVPR